MRRFSEGAFPVDFEHGLQPGQAAEIRTPTDASPVPWKLQVESTGTVTACGLGPA